MLGDAGGLGVALAREGLKTGGDDTAAATALALADADGAALEVNEVAPVVFATRTVIFHKAMMAGGNEQLVNRE